MSEKDKPDIDERNEESLGQLSSSISNAWQYNRAHFINSSIEQVPNVSPMDIHRDLVDPACSLSSMVESLGPAIWEHPVSSATPLSFNQMNVHIGSSTSDPLMMLKGNQFSPSASGMISPSLSHFPADSGFIERAARFSNFSRGHFPDMPNLFDLHRSENPCHQSETMIQAHPEVLTGNAMKLPDSRQTQKGSAISLAPQGGLFEGSPSRRVSAERPSDEAETVRISGNNSEEAQPSGRGTQEDGGAPSKGLGPKKRKRTYHDVEPEQDNGVSQLSKNAAKNNTESQQKGEQSLSPASNKSNRKHSKEVSQASVPPKGEYIHVRAQRGQATNSHSLAERIRREKISERMKFLQDLVPGCNKVTGKAVMLDEIINYVQSLQRQVEFLSMKLAMVNPSLDHNIDQLLAKSHMLAAAGPSSGRISLDMPMVHPPLHPNQPSILQPGLPSFGNSSDALRRTVSPQLEDTSSKEPIRKITNMWEDELHHIVQTGLNASAPFKNQEPNSHS